MKIWYATSAEHSAALTIVGTFHREEDAQAAEALLKGMIQTATQAEVEVEPLRHQEMEAHSAAVLAAGFPERFAALFAGKTLPTAPYPSSESVLEQKWRDGVALHKVKGVSQRDFYDLVGAETTVEPAAGKRVEIRTDEWNFQGLVSVLLERGATVEIQRW
ncbi:hypothetical protein CfE428DRAFT_5980 [Chthoniobacter flavus Ellin428]|uniref:Uncharacterized protein n=1 Tax=Chthoniobacter flavus Ellin428 TaxID=497964 RepID=B4DAN9_9BACT|nr:DUF6375 family protein [Chthoniobacter flavus]EDY16557.1 hypothetical protein CfE428DRAFT_5980 [Chthoniobacter flavus Ellin428]TCO82455.1 hypothetical protein EV701_1473 [Chthoniobacter flavus]